RRRLDVDAVHNINEQQPIDPEQKGARNRKPDSFSALPAVELLEPPDVILQRLSSRNADNKAKCDQRKQDTEEGDLTSWVRLKPSEGYRKESPNDKSQNGCRIMLANAHAPSPGRAAIYYVAARFDKCCVGNYFRVRLHPRVLISNTSPRSFLFWNRLELYITNMVCGRCVEAVRVAFEQAGLPPEQVTLGRVTIREEDPSEEALQRVDELLQQSGFERISDRKSRMIEAVKNVVIDRIHHSERLDLKTN